ncbi:MAG: hypothetical protein KZQ95_12825 [Candidatus Thiodiazotropha sp. (ex Epidulcina cf. delphinae)]|nr:hypothetical protein [Candidatus Thiodiazotropha sp. (ex Epidulcina cf. delphinae)]
MSDKQVEQLKEEVLTLGHPLGNKVFEYSDDRYDPHLYHLLFNWHPDHFHEDKGIRPSIILGRRGAGKSSYLNNLSHKKDVVAVPVKSWDAVDLIEKQVKLILNNQNSLDAEKVAHIWHLVFLTLATKALVRLAPSSEEIKAIVQNIPIKNFAAKAFIVIAKEMLEVLKNKYLQNNDTSFDLSTISDSIGLWCNSLSEWELILSGAAKNVGKVIIIMIDNPELLEPNADFDWERSYSEASKPRWHTYAGLLTLLAHFNEGKVGIQARYCVAAEQYFFLQERSSAILKDFSNIQVLHWSSGEILSALAHRYMVYLQLHPQNRNDKKYKNLKMVPIYSRNGAFEFFRMVFEEYVTNKREHTEKTITYLLRHTQLLPRQVILYTNKAIQIALQNDPMYDLTHLDSKLLRYAIETNEDLCAREIIDSYRPVFPEGRELMDTIDDIPLISLLEDLKRDWSKLGAKKVLNKYLAFPGVTVEADRFIRFLVEVGVIGRVQSSGDLKNGDYVNAEYEYTLPQRLHVHSNDYIAIHPIFSNHASPQRYSDLDPYKGVYPKGTDLDAAIDKLAIKNKYIWG